MLKDYIRKQEIELKNIYGDDIEKGDIMMIIMEDPLGDDAKNDNSEISLLKSELYDVMEHSVNPEIHSIFREQPYLPISDYAGILDVEELGFLYDEIMRVEVE